MATGKRPDGDIFAAGAKEGEVLDFPSVPRGWGVTVDGQDADGNSVTDPTNGIPPMEWFNSLLQRTDQNIWWLLQNAIPEWLVGTWPAKAIVAHNDVAWRAVKETSLEPGKDNGDWVFIFPLANLDERYLQAGNNLDDVADAAKSRKNLGLKTAAVNDIVTTMTDTTEGRVPVVGWMGLGGNALPSPVSSSNDLTKLTGLPYSAFREYTTGDGSVYLIGVSGVSPSGNAVEWLAPENGADGKKIAIRNKDNLFTLYSDKNKPNASDVGALPLSGGTLTSNGAFISLLNSTKGGSNYILAKDTDGANRWFIGNGSDGSYDTAFSNYKGGGNNIALRADGSITIFAANGKNVNVTGQIIPSVYANFDARYVKDIQLGAQSLSKTANDSGGSLYLPAGCVTTGYTSPASSDANNIHFYYKPIQKSVNGTWYNIAG